MMVSRRFCAFAANHVAEARCMQAWNSPLGGTHGLMSAVEGCIYLAGDLKTLLAMRSPEVHGMVASVSQCSLHDCFVSTHAVCALECCGSIARHRFSISCARIRRAIASCHADPQCKGWGLQFARRDACKATRAFRTQHGVAIGSTGKACMYIPYAHDVLCRFSAKPLHARASSALMFLCESQQ